MSVIRLCTESPFIPQPRQGDFSAIELKVSKTRDSHAFWNKAVKQHYHEKNHWSDLIKQYRRKI